MRFATSYVGTSASSVSMPTRGFEPVALSRPIIRGTRSVQSVSPRDLRTTGKRSSAPSLTARVSGANSSEKLRSDASTPSQDLTLAGLVAFVIWIVLAIVWAICLWKAWSGERWKLPLAGDYAERFV